MNVNKLIPIISQAVTLSRYDDSNYIIQQREYNYYLKLTTESFKLFELANGVRTIEEIKNTYNLRFDNKLKLEEVYGFFYKILVSKGIVEVDNIEISRRERSRYLYFSTELISSNTISRIIKPFSWFFEKNIFWFFFLNSAALIVVMYLNNMIKIVEEISSNNGVIIFSASFIFFSLLSSLVHELGHSAACFRFGAKIGGIGFGFYLFSPVFYSDVSGAWMLRKRERVLVNIGGVYFEILLSACCFIIYIISNRPFFLIAPFAILVNTLYNLNPLIKYDGYWILSDLISVPNLHESSKNKISCLLKNFNVRYIRNVSLKDWFLVVYSAISLSYIAVFLGVLIISDSNSIISFPKDIFDAIYYNQWGMMDIKSLMIPVVFWIIVLKQSVFFIWNKLIKSV